MHVSLRGTQGLSDNMLFAGHSVSELTRASLSATKADKLITLPHIINDERQKVADGGDTPSSILFRKHGHLKIHTGKTPLNPHTHTCTLRHTKVHMTTPVHICIQ